jgi:acetyl esterase/lipase
MGNKGLYRVALFCVIAWSAVSRLMAQTSGLQLPPAPALVAQPLVTAPAPSAPPIPREDWSVLRVDSASLQPVSVALIGYVEHPEYTMELLRVEWRHSDPIDLYVVTPHGVKNPPVVLYLYGYPADSDLFRGEGWCKRVTQDGFAAVGFASALTGQRYANRPMKEWFVSELQESLGSTVHDVQMILNYLASRGDLDVSHVGMFGQGSGGAIAVLAAQADPRISALDLLNPWGDWSDWLKSSPQVPEAERARYLTPEFLKRVENLDPILYLPKLNLKDLRIQQVMDDPVTPAIAKQKIAASVRYPEQLVQYNDTSAYRDAWRVSGLPEWIHKQLRPSQPSESSRGIQPVAPVIAGQNTLPTPKLQAVQ